ncbi:uncharacterized protein LOC122363367 isoform X2 [Amphibalanus amphitrite]|uniref:uncharacterized protein LOC122363367 isoform X1 n=1 Tax=Amphibalanus amphitrite TaxID=1232801 RepID=UPI001C923259|nr:uncharacterized protein LOC122363367 isoform X1 [Amphibalanus amphitrite]XP_043188494.1 uncharacterized protein LOC122363367 isoform X2 [Amphibalanus amphitrite]
MAFVSVAAIGDFFQTMSSVIEKGERALDGGKIRSIALQDGKYIVASVEASMKKRTYDVQVTVENKKPVDGSCTCPNGQHRCSHMAAILLYAQKNWSQTDRQCQWNRGSSNATMLKAKEMFPQEDSSLLVSSVKEDQLAWLYDQVREQPCGLAWLLAPESQSSPEEKVPNIDSILTSAEFHASADKSHFLLAMLSLSKEEIAEVQRVTSGQVKNPKWFVARKGRLTSSNFGLVLKAIARGRYPKSLFKRLLGGYDPSGSAAVKWGRTHEAAAKRAYENRTGKKVEENGIFLSEDGMLGASPDGVVGDTLLEVKCPWTHRGRTIQEAVQADGKFFLDENLNLKEDHDYFHQVQGQMWLSGFTKCDFVVWTTRDLHIVTITRSVSWTVNLELLKQFYRVHMVPSIIGSA